MWQDAPATVTFVRPSREIHGESRSEAAMRRGTRDALIVPNCQRVDLTSTERDSERSWSMMRAQQSGSNDGEWRGVSVRRPCPVCGSNEGCFVHEEDAFASCAKRPSDWPLVNGAWLHRVDSASALAKLG